MDAATWGSAPQAIPEAQAHRPNVITIHHGGVRWKPGADPAASARALQKFGQNFRAWPDVPYHYLIAPDGRILEGRPVRFAPQSNTSYAVAGHIGVQLWGNFEEERVGLAQLQSLVHLLAWLSQEHAIDLNSLRGHQHWVQTACPGKDLHRYIAEGHLTRWGSSWGKDKLNTVKGGEWSAATLLAPLTDGPLEFISLSVKG